MKHKLHHHHKEEAKHHKIRHEHKMANKSLKAAEHEQHPGVDSHGNPGKMSHLVGGVVNDNHQEGISRVLQRKGDMEVNQHGSMSGGWKHSEHMQELTPRKG